MSALWAHLDTLAPGLLPDVWRAADGALYTGLPALAQSADGIAALAALGWYPVRYDPLPLWAFAHGTPYLDAADSVIVYPPEEVDPVLQVERVRALAAAALTAERQRRITALLGDVPQQLRNLANAVSLLDLLATGIELTAEQEAIRLQLEQVMIVRMLIDDAEAAIALDIAAATTVEELTALHSTIPTDPRWP